MKKIALITFLVFMVEAIIHYNQGLSAERKQNFKIPPTKNLIQIAVVVMFFAFINSYLIDKTILK